jgi:sugar lactone lactonase YvrE
VSSWPRTEPFVDSLCFSECPRWHENRLWFSDFYDSAVFSVDPAGRRRLEVEVPGQPAGLGWLPDGRLLAVSRLERRLYRREPDGTLAVHGELHPWATFHANDMVVTAGGRAYVGNFGFDLEAFYAGGPDAPAFTKAPIIRVDPDGRTEVATPTLSFPNGMVIFPGGRLLVVGESFAGRMTAFDIASDGTLSGQRVWAKLEGVAPDGCCLDAEGCIWIANAGGPECVRVTQGGEVVDRVMTEEPCFACMLGGEDRRRLYCVIGPTSNPPDVDGLSLGRIVSARVAVPGAGLP